MRLLCCLVLLWGLFACSGGSRGPALGRLSASIINGQKDLSHPAVGALALKQSYPFCTGTLIAASWAVTAAHCVDALIKYQNQGHTVYFRIDTPGGAEFQSQYISISQAIRHPTYVQSKQAAYDIALLKLGQSVSQIQPIALHQSAMDATWVGRKVLVMGYGLTSTQPAPGTLTNHKHSVEIPIYQVDTGIFVHYDQQTSKSACHGDSGGPALMQVNGVWTILGVTSIAFRATANPSGNPPTLCDGGAVDCRIDSHLSTFIQQHISSSACQTGQSRPCYTGPQGTEGRGACKGGTQGCQGGAWGGCVGEILPQATEQCDGLDNNCNGQADEGCECTPGQSRPCYGGPAGTKGVGLCKAGEERCVGGRWGSCVGAILPQPKEQCDNGQDENCDGQVDENCCQEGAKDSCYTGAKGTWNVGACKAGVRSCVGGRWSGCVGEVLPRSFETCGDQLDNNCNGSVDEGCASSFCVEGQEQSCFTGPAGVLGNSPCRPGRKKCVSGVWTTCTEQILPQREICGDQIDNDCNGVIDDNCASSVPDLGSETQWRVRGAGCAMMEPQNGWPPFSFSGGLLCLLLLWRHRRRPRNVH